MNSERKAFLKHWYISKRSLKSEDEYAWEAWQASTQRQGYKLVPVEMSWQKADEIACKHWNDYARSHEVQNQGQSATANSIESARLTWCKNKAHQIMSDYKAMIGAVDE